MLKYLYGVLNSVLMGFIAFTSLFLNAIIVLFFPFYSKKIYPEIGRGILNRINIISLLVLS